MSAKQFIVDFYPNNVTKRVPIYQKKLGDAFLGGFMWSKTSDTVSLSNGMLLRLVDTREVDLKQKRTKRPRIRAFEIYFKDGKQMFIHSNSKTHAYFLDVRDLVGTIWSVTDDELTNIFVSHAIEELW